MVKEMIHGNKRNGEGNDPRLYFPSSSFPSAFFPLFSFSEPLNLSPYMTIYRESHLVQGKLAQASCLLRLEVISSPWRVACLGLNLFLGPSELDASLGEFRVRKL